MSETAVQPTKSFEERMMDRIRDSIGDIITDEELKKIIERGVEKVFFEKKPSGNSWNSTPRNSFIEDAVETFLRLKMAEAVDKWIKENPDKVLAAVENCIKAGVSRCLLDTLDSRFGMVFHGMIEQMKCSGQLPRI